MDDRELPHPSSEASLTPERYVRVHEILDEALAHSHSERRAFLSAACGADLGLLREASALLDAQEALDSTDTPVPPGMTIGPYRVERELGRGAMGVVYQARQVALNRSVALKLILSGQFASPADIARFRVEAEAAASLDHPHIVAVYDVGQHEGHHFFSMQLIEGTTLAHDLPRLHEHPREGVGLLAKICRAVHYAHERGILHRDLKPSNILLDRRGEPHVSDFGVAKRLDDDGQLTRTGAAIGTPGYMAPEQAAPGPEAVLTSAADVYSLGAILYELLTRLAPFSGLSPIDTLVALVKQPPERPRALNAKADRDLEAIALQCLEKEPTRRYASAGVLADDLERWLVHKPILARPVYRWTVPRRWTVSLTIVAMTLALVVGVWAAWFSNAVAPAQTDSVAVRVFIDATPWATVKQIERDNGQLVRLPARPAYTPLALLLLPGRYTVSLEGPQGPTQSQDIEYNVRRSMSFEETESRVVFGSAKEQVVDQLAKLDSARPSSTKAPAKSAEEGSVIPASLGIGTAMFFKGQYKQALDVLTPEVAAVVPADLKSQVYVLRAAALFALYNYSGETDEPLRDRAAQEVRRLRSHDASFTPEPNAFSPRFISFFRSTLGEMIVPAGGQTNVGGLSSSTLSPAPPAAASTEIDEATRDDLMRVWADAYRRLDSAAMARLYPGVSTDSRISQRVNTFRNENVSCTLTYANWTRTIGSRWNVETTEACYRIGVRPVPRTFSQSITFQKENSGRWTILSIIGL